MALRKCCHFFQAAAKEKEDLQTKVKSLTAEKTRLQQIGDSRVKNGAKVFVRMKFVRQACLIIRTTFSACGVFRKQFVFLKVDLCKIFFLWPMPSFLK
jgi:GT2 family glycosyltransferase